MKGFVTDQSRPPLVTLGLFAFALFSMIPPGYMATPARTQSGDIVLITVCTGFGQPIKQLQLDLNTGEYTEVEASPGDHSGGKAPCAHSLCSGKSPALLAQLPDTIFFGSDQTASLPEKSGIRIASHPPLPARGPPDRAVV